MSRPAGTNAIAESGHEEEVRELLIDRWPAKRVSDWLERVYDIHITADAIAGYKKRNIEEKAVRAPDFIEDAIKERAQKIDVAVKRAEMIQYQIVRLKTYGETELSMKALLTEQRYNLELLNQMLTEYKKDLQDLGYFPKAEDKLKLSGEVRTTGHLEDDDDTRKLFGDLMGRWKPERIGRG